MATKNIEKFSFDELAIVGRPFISPEEAPQEEQFASFKPVFDLNQYKTYYYTGGQAQIYLEDVFLDEVSSLQFSTITNKAPIYGYASERFDTVAKGNMIVQGSFSINFVSTGYLQIISQVVREGNGSATGLEAVKTSAVKFNGSGFLTSENATEFQTQQALNQLRGLGNNEFRELSIKLRKERGSKGALGKQFYELPPFDIFAVFGDHLDPHSNHTVRKIKDVYLTGQSQVIYASGEPIQEQYSFIARDIE